MMDSVNKSNIHRALIFQGGGSLGAYEAGAYKAINDELSAFLRNIGSFSLERAFLRAESSSLMALYAPASYAPREPPP